MQDQPAGGELDLAEIIATIRSAWWKILALSVGAGTIVLLFLFTEPNYYRSRAVITPTGEENRQMGALGAIGASLGFQLGGPSKIEDLESLFRSYDLTARVFSQHDIWQDVLGSAYDPTAKAFRKGLLARIFSSKPPAAPGDWDAIRSAEESLKTLVNKRAGTVTLTFESLSAESSARIVRFYLDEAKSRLQDEALQRAQRNRKFLEEQIAATSDALAKDKLFTLLGQEIEREMMARNREEFGFRIIDAPRVPDRKSGPKRALIALSVTIVSLFAFAFYFLQAKRPPSQAGRDAPPVDAS